MSHAADLKVKCFKDHKSNKSITENLSVLLKIK